ncbi:hypothetical protein FMM79_00770 [Novosphingobium sp. BW1]|nr:hypothetical protein FMM79_00770 [Novosphingobium sp. BW1]
MASMLGFAVALPACSAPTSPTRAEAVTVASSDTAIWNAAVEPFADHPPMGGSAIDSQGNLYFPLLSDNLIRRRAPDGTTTTPISGPRLHWVDAMFITAMEGC